MLLLDRPECRRRRRLHATHAHVTGTYFHDKPKNERETGMNEPSQLTSPLSRTIFPSVWPRLPLRCAFLCRLLALGLITILPPNEKTIRFAVYWIGCLHHATLSSITQSLNQIKTSNCIAEQATKLNLCNDKAIKTNKSGIKAKEISKEVEERDREWNARSTCFDSSWHNYRKLISLGNIQRRFATFAIFALSSRPFLILLLFNTLEIGAINAIALQFYSSFCSRLSLSFRVGFAHVKSSIIAMSTLEWYYQ